MKPTLVVIALVTALAPCAARAGLVNENLLVSMPEGYKVGWQDKNAQRIMSEMVPAAQTVDNWTEMVTVQVFFHLNTTPDAFRTRMQALWGKACPNSAFSEVAQGPEHGYPAALWLQACPKNPQTGKPEFTWFKAIQGHDSFYVVQKAFKYEPQRDEIGKWVGYLRKVAVCDSRLPDRACPATN